MHSFGLACWDNKTHNQDSPQARHPCSSPLGQVWTESWEGKRKGPSAGSCKLNISQPRHERGYRKGYRRKEPIFLLQVSWCSNILAGGLGFEPRLTESESVVLPLDDPPLETDPSVPNPVPVHRFEYCGRLRALCNPTFLRSTSRASRVRKPAWRNGRRSPSS